MIDTQAATVALMMVLMAITAFIPDGISEGKNPAGKASNPLDLYGEIAE